MALRMCPMLVLWHRWSCRDVMFGSILNYWGFMVVMISINVLMMVIMRVVIVSSISMWVHYMCGFGWWRSLIV